MNRLEEVDLGIKMGRNNKGRSHTRQNVREDCKECTEREIPAKILLKLSSFFTTHFFYYHLLPFNVVNARTMYSFKARLNAHVGSGYLTKFNNWQNNPVHIILVTSICIRDKNKQI